ncbi:predicted protein [Naegleria gruberi]|uniref:Predicted protein n=1 Tax=Naegleria gruberi TaxID=5762 RepID=D2VM33_NAEGR|nr:uncharacterized protein NAEGRDRAFT_69994 [Naegleria gruberi]EFC42249.1 predicted protein [Naegleria gruberi]|eukprot:XP_002674993.1 predicted protein [Naegleria gruberi strain NEG-M]
MVKLTTGIILLLLITFTVVLTECVQVNLIDSNPTLQRYLLRGDSPVIGLNLDMKTLQTAIQAEIKSKTNQNVDDFYLVDISVLKVDSVVQEEAYFAMHSKEGEFIHWPLVGNPANISGLPEWLQASLVVEGQGVWNLEDQLIGRVDQLTHWVHNKTSINNLKSHHQSNIVFFIHDDNGVDQTGEISGAYYLANFGWTWSKTLLYNSLIHKKYQPMPKWNINEMNWYCFYLYFNNKGPDTCNY